MKIAIPSANGKLCAHFGHCEYFTFVEVEDNQITKIESKIPEEGISCRSAIWVAEQGAEIIIAGGMGGRPLSAFEEQGVEVILGCPEIEIETLIKAYIEGSLVAGENSCGGGHHNCHHGSEHHCCH